MEEELIEKGLSLTYDECETEFSVVPLKKIVKTEKYINGDHWQNQEGWVGWTPESVTKTAANTMAFIEKAFNMKNVIGGMIKRMKGAIAGQQPDFSIVPKDKETVTPEELALYAKLNFALNEWFTTKDVHEQIKKFVHNRTAHGKACLRIHIPIGLLKKDGAGFTVPATDFASALDYIYVTAHDAGTYTDGTDVNFGEKYSVVKLQGNVNPSDTDEKQHSFEVSYVDKDKMTVVRNLYKDKEGAPPKPFRLDLGGNPLCVVKGRFEEAIISESQWRMQNAVNCAKTNETLAGNNINFPETTFIDLDLPKEAVLQPNGKYKEQTVVPSGMGIWRSFKSRLFQDAEGGEQIARGQIVTRQQADPEHFARIAANNTRDMHQEAGMLYIYLADSEYASGDAKIEAMADYLILIIDNATELDVVGSWIGNTVTRLALRFAKMEDRLKDKFSFMYSSKLTLGHLTVEERRLMIEEVNQLLRSRRSYQVKAGISDDPDKETIEIEREVKEMSPELKEIAYPKSEQALPPKTAAG